jgi:tetratricopeptide (TPR) repeat protein
MGKSQNQLALEKLLSNVQTIDDLDICYSYLDIADTKTERVTILKKIISIDPDDVTSRVMLVRENAGDIEKELAGIKKVIVNEEKKLKKLNIISDDDIGEYWTIYETRSYMRARYEYITSLIHSGAIHQAIDECKDMLRLSTGDNLGVRHILITLYAYLEDEKSAMELYNSHGGNADDLFFLLPISLLYFKLGNYAESERYLEELNSINDDTWEFFSEMINVDYDFLENIDTGIGFRLDDITGLVQAFNENPYLYLSSPLFFEWGCKKLK